jgi:hypothetical protein
MGPQVGSFIRIGEEEKWYCTLMSIQVVSFIHAKEEKNDVAHFWARKWFL